MNQSANPVRRRRTLGAGDFPSGIQNSGYYNYGVRDTRGTYNNNNNSNLQVGDSRATLANSRAMTAAGGNNNSSSVHSRRSYGTMSARQQQVNNASRVAVQSMPVSGMMSRGSGNESRDSRASAASRVSPVESGSSSRNSPTAIGGTTTARRRSQYIEDARRSSSVASTSTAYRNQNNNPQNRVASAYRNPQNAANAANVGAGGNTISFEINGNRSRPLSSIQSRNQR